MKRLLVSVVVPFLERHPRLMALARRVQFLVWHFKVRVRTLRYGPALPDPETTYWIDPERIEYALIIEELNRNDKYRLRGGSLRRGLGPEESQVHGSRRRGFPWAAGEICAGVAMGRD